MTRPSIVRADTLDLQDEDHPSAAEHPKHLQQTGLAPHQRAQISHVFEERHSEEQALSEAWNISDDIVEEPDAIDIAQEQGGIAGGVYGGEDEGIMEGGDSEVDIDDEMMDRISSSPSIDDGAYTTDFDSSLGHRTWRTNWPECYSSRITSSPYPSMHAGSETFNQSAPSKPYSTPVLQTVQRFAMGLPVVTRSATFCGPSSEVSQVRSGELLEETNVTNCRMSSSPSPSPSLSLRQRRLSRYTSTNWSYRGTLNTKPQAPGHDRDLDFHLGTNAFASSPKIETVTDVVLASGKAVLIDDLTGEPRIDTRRHSHVQQEDDSETSLPMNSHLEPSSSFSSINSDILKELLLPVDDPLLDNPLSPVESTDSWETFSSTNSDASISPQHSKDDKTHFSFAHHVHYMTYSDLNAECLREIEDIDFEFVYALHTFVATVEGQANATKGDTMVLLDDSNSYWWLVRVVKDQSIGYLPAEHIETPTERLARLNKHRNIDLSATMLSDNSERSRNPLKKAMRRRNAKTVQFTAPTYVEASDYEYSDEEDDAGSDPYAIASGDQQTQHNDEQGPDAIEEPKAASDQSARSSSPRRRSFDREQAAMAAAALNNDDDPPLSPKFVDKTEAAPLKSRKGTPRNADSFLKDDSIETRKITITPGILREDNASAGSESSEITRSDSLDKEISSLTKQQSATEQPLAKKDSKKDKKDKKPGMLSGLFKSKKKDKKAKEDFQSEGDVDKGSVEISRTSSRDGSASIDKTSPSQSPDLASENRYTDVQTRQPTRGDGTSATDALSGHTEDQSSQARHRDDQELQDGRSTIAQPLTRPAPGSTPTRQREAEKAQSQQPRLNIQTGTQSSQETSNVASPLGPITNLLKRDDSKSQKPAKARRSKERIELDDFDSPVGGENDARQTFYDHDDTEASNDHDDSEALSESPIEIMPGSFIQSTEHIETSAQANGNQHMDRRQLSSDSLSTGSASFIEHPGGENINASPSDRDAQESEDSEPTPTGPRSPLAVDSLPQGKLKNTTSTNISDNINNTNTPDRNMSTDSVTTSTTTTSAPTPTGSQQSISQQSWSESSLRTWLDDGSEIKDMMVLIHDTSGVEPVGQDHPLMQDLFVEQRKGVQDMMDQLDGLLGGLLQSRGIVIR